MESYWINDQEASYAWLASPSASEQEDVLDWIKSIGVGAAQGAGTGVAAGPWGALIGGLIGGGLGALQQATQPQPAPQRPATPRPAPPPPVVPARPAAQPQPLADPAPSAPLSSSRNEAGALQQVVQLLPQLVQLLQTIRPAAAPTQPSTGRTGESVEGNLESLAGDRVPDGAFVDEQEADSWHDEEDENEHIELPEPLEPTQPPQMDALPTSNSALPPLGTPTLSFPDDWVTETESFGIAGAGFQWVG